MTDKAELSSTERQLRDALARLVHQKPINRELKQKLKANKLKIVVSNVEKEAGLSNGSARRYPETKAPKFDVSKKPAHPRCRQPGHPFKRSYFGISRR